MKRRFRQKALNALFAQLQSEDFDRREHALFLLALLLRRANPNTSQGDLPEHDSESLPRELQRLRLDAQEQGQIADRLALLIRGRRESRMTAFWTMGKLAAEIGWAPTLTLLQFCGEQLDGEAATQVCRALRRWLELDAWSAPLLKGSDASEFANLIRVWAASDIEGLQREASAVLGLLPGHVP